MKLPSIPGAVTSDTLQSHGLRGTNKVHSKLFSTITGHGTFDGIQLIKILYALPVQKRYK